MTNPLLFSSPSFYFFAKQTVLFMKGVVFVMRTYSVKEISTLLNVNEETVRRWIRTGRLKSTIKSYKNGHVISEFDLYEFVNMNRKYRRGLDLNKVTIDDPYVKNLERLLNDLISERDVLNDRIDKIRTLLEEL